MKFLSSSACHAYIDRWPTALPLRIIRVSECSDWGFFSRVFWIISADGSGIKHVFCDEPASLWVITVAEFIELGTLPIFDHSASKSALLVTDVGGPSADDFLTVLFLYEGTFFECGVVDIALELSGGAVRVFHQTHMSVRFRDYFFLSTRNTSTGEQG